MASSSRCRRLLLAMAAVAAVWCVHDVAAQPRTDLSTLDAKIAAFKQWLDTNGVDTSYWTLRHTEVGLGVVLTRAVNRTEQRSKVPMWIPVPQRLFFSPNATPANESIVMKWIADIEAGTGTFVACDTKVAYLMLYEQFYQPNSFWRPYLDLMPTEFPDLPHRYTGVEAELAATNFQLREAMDRLQWSFTKVADVFVQWVASKNPDVFGPHTPDNEARWRAQLDWASCIVLTRLAGGLPHVDCAVTPLLDFANYRSDMDPITTFVDPSQQLWAGVALDTPHEAGDELLISYDDDKHEKCDFTLAAVYGLIANDTKHSCAALHITVHLNMLPTQYLSILKELELTTDSDEYVTTTIVSGRPIAHNVLAASRIITATESELQFKQRALDGPISYHSEHRLLKELFQQSTKLKDQSRTAWKAVMAAHPELSDPTSWSYHVRLLFKLHQDLLRGLDAIKVELKKLFQALQEDDSLPFVL